MGHILTRDDAKVDPVKIDAITEWLEARNTEKFMDFLVSPDIIDASSRGILQSLCR